METALCSSFHRKKLTVTWLLITLILNMKQKQIWRGKQQMKDDLGNLNHKSTQLSLWNLCLIILSSTEDSYVFNNTFPAFSPRILWLSPGPFAIMLHFETGRVLIALLSWAQTHPWYSQLPFSACQHFGEMHLLQISCTGDIIIWTTFKVSRKERAVK